MLEHEGSKIKQQRRIHVETDMRLTSSKETADVLRGDGRWKHDRRRVHMTGKSEAASEYPASLVVAMLSAIKRQMISDGAHQSRRTAFCRSSAR